MELDKIELFSTLSHSEISQISSIARRVHLTRGEAVFNEGDFEKNIYIARLARSKFSSERP